MVWPNDKLPPKSSLKENAPVLTRDRTRAARADRVRKARDSAAHLHLEPHGLRLAGAGDSGSDAKLTKEYGLVTPFDLGVQDIGHVYEGTDTGAVKATKLAARLEALGPGTWLIVDHAAVDTPETQALGHPGYENVAADRSAVLEAWTSSAVKDVIRRRGSR